MKFIRFNFCHPIIGRASLIQLSTEHPNSHSLEINTRNSNVVEIPLDGCAVGKWKVVLNWQHDEQSFTHEKKFEIKKNLTASR